ncbi:LOW QUALITY PROTEIN: uncharacterized protein LOC117340733 [Pecten maximus]|uniref:LOW QUALITY PROTEIN: uncharacterized protein LOC117340733 n=1 Tax=Pecten maximus TaxID=6579 RepID=UPI0014583F76|nr:LOW QUALITY PROTEIN: uncharacterized protein LOC117340733 [Pecten maximus]
MAYGVVFVTVLTVAFAINGQEDDKYATLQYEVMALKKFVLNMNVELDNVRKLYDEMRQELMTVRSKQKSMSNYHPGTSQHGDQGEITLPNKRSTAYVPTMHLSNVWNGSKASGPKGEQGKSGPKGSKGGTGPPGYQGPKGRHGQKGDKGELGIVGPKGESGTAGIGGQKGEFGMPGVKGEKGDTGKPGLVGYKGSRGMPGLTGPMGPKGDVGQTGNPGQKGDTGGPGPRGRTGTQGATGQKGDTGKAGVPGPRWPCGRSGDKGQKGDTGRPGLSSNNGMNISFSLATNLRRSRKNDVPVMFDSVYWNDGNHFNPSTGIFTCPLPGTYLFILTVTGTQGEEIQISINRSRQPWRYLSESGSSINSTESVTTTAEVVARGNCLDTSDFLTVAFAFNGQEDNKYAALQYEVSTLKKFVLNMNFELDNVRKQYDEMREELMTVSCNKNTTDIFEAASGPKGNKGTSGPKGSKGDTGTPGLQGPKGDNGQKGDKGELGIVGPKGESGTSGIGGQKGEFGMPGVKGEKGDTGQPGLVGNKGSRGMPGVTGPMGPKGDIGLTGNKGQKGDTGKTGATGPRGPIGRQGVSGPSGRQGVRGPSGRPGASPKVMNVSFSVATNLRRIRQQGMRLMFESVNWNDGNHFNPFNGKFKCHVPGTYLFISTVTVSQGDEIQLSINRNGQPWRNLSGSGSSMNSTESVTTTLKLSHGETVSINLIKRSRHSSAICFFEGLLLKISLNESLTRRNVLGERNTQQAKWSPLIEWSNWTHGKMVVVVSFILALTVAINGQQDQKYEHLQNEVMVLKKLISNINMELESMRKQYDEVCYELRTIRTKHQLMDKEMTNQMKKQNTQQIPSRHKDYAGKNERTAPAIPSSNHWNTSTDNTLSLQHGFKGEKGDPGIPGVKGDPGSPGSVGRNGEPGPPGTTGQKGDSGPPGAIGEKGDIGPSGPMGPKGNSGAAGRTGLQGPPGIKGNNGWNGIPGSKGEIGQQGLQGQKGEPGFSTPSRKSAFYVITHSTVHHTYQTIQSTNPLTNIGNDFDTRTGVFTCSIPGIYLFTWSVGVWQREHVYSHIDISGVLWSDLGVSGSNDSWNTG